MNSEQQPAVCAVEQVSKDKMQARESATSSPTLSKAPLPEMQNNDLIELQGDDVDPVYRAKARLLNEAIRDIGVGKYQWSLFVVAGFGWFADSVWPLVTGLILPPVINEFQLGGRGPYLSLASNIGLLVGATFWGLGCDIWGRKLAFNTTLLITGIFALAAGGSPNFITLACLVAVLGIGVGGNMPIDSAVFLEFLPGSHQYLLTTLSVWWAIGQLVAALIAWPLIANFSCADAAFCTRTDNKGWRLLLFTLGGLNILLWIIRFFVFTLYESPRFLVSMGRDEDAVEVLRKLAKYNGKEENDWKGISVQDLRSVGSEASISQPDAVVGVKDAHHLAPSKAGASELTSKTLKETWSRIKSLFVTRRMGLATTLLIFLWALIGLASTLYNQFLPFIFASRGAQFGDGSVNITYRNQVVLALVNVPAALLAGYSVDLPLLGRKGTLAISCVLTAVFLFATTTARTSNALLGWNCAYSFFSTSMYGVLYAISPEIFPANARGTGNGLTAMATRVFGVLAPIIALFANLQTAVPVWISGAMIIMAGGITLLIPFEPRGKTSL